MNRSETLAVAFVIVATASVAGGLGYLAVTIDEQPTDASEFDATAASIAGTDDLQAIHDAGVTGENVSVGVLDVTGFDTEHRSLEDRIEETRRFGDDTPAVDTGDTHGTSAAVTVARVAPDAELYLATFGTADDYEAGLEWMNQHDVDVVVAPVADAATLGDGNATLTRATTAAVDRGTVVVAPTGNLGDGHWLGEYNPTASGVHAFADGPLNPVSGPASRAEFHLAWDEPNEEYQLELYRLRADDEPVVVAQSVPRDRRDVPSARLTARLTDDSYALAVRGPSTATDTRIRVASPTHSLADARSAGSIAAPADAPGAIAVGAFDPTSGVEPYSSRGPTANGRLGVDVVAPSSYPVPGRPRFEGTSASASYVGGVAALVVDAAPELEPTEVRWTLASTAEPTDGIDAETGHGRVDPRAAVRAVLPESDAAAVAVARS